MSFVFFYLFNVFINIIILVKMGDLCEICGSIYIYLLMSFFFFGGYVVLEVFFLFMFRIFYL